MPYAPLHNAIMSIPHQKMASLGAISPQDMANRGQENILEGGDEQDFNPYESESLIERLDDQSGGSKEKKPINWMVAVPLALVAGYFLLGDS